MKPHRCRPLAVLAGAAFALAACGGGSDDPGGAGGPTETTLSPIAALMGWEQPSEEEMNRRQLQVEEMTAACMREEGWEYTPVDYSGMERQSADEEEAMDLQINDPEAYGKKYGYGIVRNYELYDLPSIEAGDTGGGSPATVVDDFVDPNQPYVESLTESEREQYYISLNGDPSIWEGSEDEDFVQPAPEEMGCQGIASAEIWEQSPADSDPDIQDRMNDYWENMESDPRLQDAYADWRDCMGDTIADLAVNDVPVDTPDDIYGYFDSRKYMLMGLEMVPYDPETDDGSEPYVMAMVDADGNGVAYQGEQQAIPGADLEELRQEELALWQQDFDCQKDAEISDVRLDLEQEFADQLRTEFPELAATEE